MSDLLTPSREIVSLDQARAEKDLEKRRPANSKMKDFVSREEMMMAVGKASLALGQKMYDQASGELAENFDDQEARLMQRIRNEVAVLRREIEARTVAGRWRRLVARLRGELPAPADLALVDQAPIMPAPDDRQAAAITELRRRIANAADGEDVKVPEGLTEAEALEIAAEYDAEVRAAIADTQKILDTPDPERAQ